MKTEKNERKRIEKEQKRLAKERVNRLAESFVGTNINYGGRLMFLPRNPKIRRR